MWSVVALAIIYTMDKNFHLCRWVDCSNLLLFTASFPTNLGLYVASKAWFGLQTEFALTLEVGFS